MVAHLFEKMNGHPAITITFLMLGGVLFQFAANSWQKGVLTLLGAMCLNIGVSLAFHKGQKSARNE